MGLARVGVKDSTTRKQCSVACHKHKSCVANDWHRMNGTCVLWSAATCVEPDTSKQHTWSAGDCPRNMPRYVHLKSTARCEEAGLVAITTHQGCSAAANALGMKDSDGNVNVQRDKAELTFGCLTHRWGFVEMCIGNCSKTQPCKANHYTGCLCTNSTYVG